MAESPCLNWRKFAIPAGRIKSPLVARVSGYVSTVFIAARGIDNCNALWTSAGVVWNPPRGGPQGEPIASREEEHNSHYRIGAHNT